MLVFTLTPSIIGGGQAKAAITGFVTRSGSQLTVDGQPFRFGSANIYWLGLDENVPPGTVDYPTAFRVNDVLATAKEMGVNVVRSHAAISFGCPKCIKPTLTTYNETAFQQLDYVIKTAGDQGVRLILPLIDQYNYYHGGKKSWTKWFGYPDDGISYTGYEFYNQPAIIDAFKQYVNTLLNRVNTYTGVAYKDDPTIMAWETGNELGWFDNPTAFKNWTTEIAGYLKQLDTHHLVMDGSYGVVDSHLTIPGIDIYSDHFYQWPNVGSCCKGLSVTQLQTQATKVQNAGKVMYVGEYAWNYETQGTLSNFLSAIQSTPVIAGDAFWALFGHGDDYGYEQHNESFTVHYPGDTPAMQTAVQQMRNHAFAMRGMSVPAHGVPGAPLLTSHAVSGGKYQLKWRGSVPSATYTVERSTAGSSGPWTVVCNACATDNQTPWTDATSTSGTAAWYRVKGVNLGGVAGAYSNVYATGGTALPIPGSFALTAPSGGSTGVGVTPAFAWGASANASSYTLVVANNASYASPIINAAGLTATSYTPSAALADGTTYYWKVTAANGTGSTAASNSGLSFTTATAPPQTSTLDDFESYASDSALQTAYVRNTSGGAVTVNRDTTNKNGGTYGMKMAYTVSSSPDFAGITKQLGTANWTGKTGLQLWLKPDGSGRTLTLQFKETSGEMWETYYVMSGTSATVLQLPFTSFAHPGWYSGGNGTLDPGSISEYSIYVNKAAGSAGSGTLYVDSVAAQTFSPPPVNVAIDDFEGYGGANASLQAAYVPNASGGALTRTLDTANKNGGTYGMKLAYTVSASPDYSGATKTLGNVNWSGTTGLSLWFKPDGSNRKFTVQFKEAGGETWETAVTMSGTTASVLQLPFGVFAHPGWYSGGNGVIDKGAIGEISFYVNMGSGSAGSSSIYLDSVQAY